MRKDTNLILNELIQGLTFSVRQDSNALINAVYDGTSVLNVNVSGLDTSTITDFNIGTPSNGDVLVYNGTSGKWENSEYDIQSLENLSDIDITGATAGDMLVYGTNSKWENKTEITPSKINISTDFEVSEFNITNYTIGDEYLVQNEGYCDGLNDLGNDWLEVIFSDLLIGLTASDYVAFNSSPITIGQLEVITGDVGYYIYHFNIISGFTPIELISYKVDVTTDIYRLIISYTTNTGLNIGTGNTMSNSNSHIIGSNIETTQDDTLFVNNIISTNPIAESINSSTSDALKSTLYANDIKKSIYSSGNTASGTASIASGFGSTASSQYSIASGYKSTAYRTGMISNNGTPTISSKMAQKNQLNYYVRTTNATPTAFKSPEYNYNPGILFYNTGGVSKATGRYMVLAVSGTESNAWEGTFVSGYGVNETGATYSMNLLYDGLDVDLYIGNSDEVFGIYFDVVGKLSTTIDWYLNLEWIEILQ